MKYYAHSVKDDIDQEKWEPLFTLGRVIELLRGIASSCQGVDQF